MATTDRNGSGDVTTVVIKREYAPFVAMDVAAKLDNALEATPLALDVTTRVHAETRESMRQIRAALDHYEALLEQVAWGEPGGDVSFTADAAFLRELADNMLESDMHASANARPGMSEAQTRRWYVDEVNAGASILDQLEATS